MSVPPDPVRYLVLQGCVGAAIVNAILNGGIGVGVTLGLTTFPIWGVPGAAADLIATAFGVAFGTGLVVPFQVRKDVQRGRLSRPPVPARLAALLGRAPKGVLSRATVFGVASVPLFCPPAILALAVLGADPLGRWAFVLIKASFSAIQAAIVTPLVILSTLLVLPQISKDV